MPYIVISCHHLPVPALGNLRLLPSLDVVVVSQAPSPESKPNASLTRHRHSKAIPYRRKRCRAKQQAELAHQQHEQQQLQQESDCVPLVPRGQSGGFLLVLLPDGRFSPGTSACGTTYPGTKSAKRSRPRRGQRERASTQKKAGYVSK